jgi:hypothetical protein
LGKGLSLGVLRGLVWTVYQFCIMPTKMCGWYKIWNGWLMSWGMELQWKSRKILQVLDKCAAHPHSDSLKNI